jgi:pimeloyl-ACP methyl ester carboxylesterase
MMALRIMLMLLAVGLAASSVLAAPGDRRPSRQAGDAGQSGEALPARLGELEARAWPSAQSTGHPRLVIVLHGDLAGREDAYQYQFAGAARRALSDTVVVAILRPGYADPFGKRSVGVRGLATGDNYTPEAIKSLHAAIVTARTRYRARDVTIVGHSGGAALAADLLEVDPKLASKLLLVSCPCDLSAWRAHMARQQFNPVWLLPVRSVSPMQGIRRLSSALTLKMVVGEHDTVAPPALTQTFADGARGVGVRTSVTTLAGAGHNILLDRRVLAQLVALQAEH